MNSNTDVFRAHKLSIISDPSLHYQLYGKNQGRQLLDRITNSIENVIVIAPSYRKKCGIGEYARYLESELIKAGKKVCTIYTSADIFSIPLEVVRGSLIIVNHGPGLFDGLNEKLSQGESTTELLCNLYRARQDFDAIPLFLMHSLVDVDNEVIWTRQTMIMNSDIPKAVFIKAAAENFYIPSIELGVSPVNSAPYNNQTTDNMRPDRELRKEVIGFFGFFQYGGKDFQSLFKLLQALNAHLVGSVATSNTDELNKFNQVIQEIKATHDLGTGWVDDSELLIRLSKADYFYLPQNDYDYWNNSATARFVTNLDRPLFLPAHQPFLDMEEAAIFADINDLPKIVSKYRSSINYGKAVDRVINFRKNATLASTVESIFCEISLKLNSLGAKLLECSNSLSYEKYFHLQSNKQVDFLKILNPQYSLEGDILIESFKSIFYLPQPVQKWRKHYELSELVGLNVIETITEIYRAFTKEDPPLRKFLKIANFDHSSSKSVEAVELIETCFNDPSIKEKINNGTDSDFAILQEGECINSFFLSRASELISATINKRLKFFSHVREQVSLSMGTYIPLNNLALLLLLPPASLKIRLAGSELAKIDYDKVTSYSDYSRRLNELLLQADKHRIQLNLIAILDKPLLEDIDPFCFSYCIEDFIGYDHEYDIIINASRKILKRDLATLEFVVNIKLYRAFGLKALLDHLLEITTHNVCISEYANPLDLVSMQAKFSNFIAKVRDPLFGEASIRNKYEIAKRNIHRLHIKLDKKINELLVESNDEVGLALVYRDLHSITYPGMRIPKSAHADSIINKFILHCQSKQESPLRLHPGKLVSLNPESLQDSSVAVFGLNNVSSRGASSNSHTFSINLQLGERSDIPQGLTSIILRVKVALNTWPQIFKEGVIVARAIMLSSQENLAHKSFQIPCKVFDPARAVSHSQLTNTGNLQRVDICLPANCYGSTIKLVVTGSACAQALIHSKAEDQVHCSLRFKSIVLIPRV